MKKTSLILTSMLTFMGLSTASNADTTNVFCANNDGSKWYWLKNSSGVQQKISGSWGTEEVDAITSYKYFQVKESDYLSVNRQCQSNYVAQPAKDQLDYWRIFKVEGPNGSTYIAPGKYSTNLKRYNFGVSDQYLKQNIQNIDDSLEKLSHVNGVSYQWKSNGLTEYGVIAQEINLAFPELVSQNSLGYLQVDYRGLIPVLIESVKTLKSRIVELEARL